MSLLLELFKKVKIDFSTTVVSLSAGGELDDVFEVQPKDFLRYGKEDFETKTRKGLISGITNSKRAIDCQVDSVLKKYGIDFDSIPRESESFLKFTGVWERNLPYKLKLIQALKLAPSGLTAKARKLRNKLEHYYQVPNEKDVEEALEIAELFILSCESKVKICEYEFIVSSQKYLSQRESLFIKGKMNDYYINSIFFVFSFEDKIFELTPVVEGEVLDSLVFNQNSVEFYFLLMLMISVDDEFENLDSIRKILRYIEHPFPIDKVKVGWG